MNNKWINAIEKLCEPSVVKFLLSGVKITIIVSFFSIIFSLLLGIVLAFARNSKNKYLSRFATIYIEIMRNLPLLLLILAVRFMTPLNTLYSGIFAISIFSAAMIAEIIRGRNK